ncbi:jg27706 [Pararge aegeria aegeria]|uniref:Jg27706 protein n=1 Tax=Pararge aegeria aegeria TaxID=348720 RepID=A0A8S4R8H7_9NEOP|nr:jg27706 [Pararge aegeria aegeria]
MRNRIPNIPLKIRKLLEKKRKLRRRWHTSRYTEDKTAFNKVAKELKTTVTDNCNNAYQHKLSTLSASGRDGYTLWKITKDFKRPKRPIPPLRLPSGDWARTPIEKAELFAHT